MAFLESRALTVNEFGAPAATVLGSPRDRKVHRRRGHRNDRLARQPLEPGAEVRLRGELVEAGARRRRHLARSHRAAVGHREVLVRGAVVGDIDRPRPGAGDRSRERAGQGARQLLDHHIARQRRVRGLRRRPTGRHDDAQLTRSRGARRHLEGERVARAASRCRRRRNRDRQRLLPRERTRTRNSKDHDRHDHEQPEPKQRPLIRSSH